MKKHLFFILASLLLVSVSMLAQKTNTEKAFELKNTKDTEIPEISYSSVEPSYVTDSDIIITASVSSNGLIDQLCGVGYKIYKDGEIIDNVADYGTLTYKVRQEEEEYFDGVITNGAGMIEVFAAEENIGAFTLGIFDTYCVDRNRPIKFTANFTVPGVYKMVSTIYSCSNTETITISNFNANEICGGGIHEDKIGKTCEGQNSIAEKSISVTVNTKLVVNIHTSDNLYSCKGETVVLDAKVGKTWEWSTGSTNSKINVSTEGWYFVTVNDEFDAEAIDSVYVHFNELPLIDLGKDKEYCSDVPNTITAPDASSYLWSTNETTKEITPINTGKYYCTITDENGCKNSDFININIHQTPNAELGPDATIQADQSILIGVPAGAFKYEWSTGATTSHILIKGSDAELNSGSHTYSITVTTLSLPTFQGCKSNDQITITLIPTNITDDVANKISINPNPTNGIINILGQNIKNISIYDNIGKELISTKNSNIDLTKYPAGMYFVKISTNTEIITKKLIKQ